METSGNHPYEDRKPHSPKTTRFSEKDEVEQFPEPPQLQRSNAYLGESEQPPPPGTESRDDTGKESTEDLSEEVSQSGDDTASDDDDVSETDGSEGSETEGSDYSEDTDIEESEPETKKDVGRVNKKRPRKKMSNADIEDTVRRYLNTRYLLSKKKDLLGDNFFV